MKALTTKYRFIAGVLACAAGIPSLMADLLQDGRKAFLNYDFELASELYEKYAKSLKKNPDADGEEILSKYLRQLEMAENSLDNIQKIEIIDRMDVPAADFFRFIKLPASGSIILPPDVPVLNKRRNQSDFAYSSESGDMMMWSESGDDGQEFIMQSERLMDGSWEKPHRAGEILNDGGNARNPFMLTDGVTLYYSSDGDGSMGGYDIFVASKDPVSGEFRQPIGVGYPFNSPFNEYMMAIDEGNGIGWWVTDRHSLDGQVSVYVFKTNEVRKNYVPDEEEDIIPLAKLADISLSQNPETDYKALLVGIDERSRISKSSSEGDFLFPMPQGRVARSMSDFHSEDARRSMQQYLKAVKDQQDIADKLSDLRKRYHKTDQKLSSSTALMHEIIDLEKKRELCIERLKQMRNAVITAEIKK